MATDAYAQIGEGNIVTQIIMADDIDTAKEILGDTARLVEDWALVGWVYNSENNSYSDPNYVEPEPYPNPGTAIKHF
jgi:hypothetical protein